MIIVVGSFLSVDADIRCLLIAPLSQQLYSRDFDFHNFSSPGLTEVEDDTFDGTLAITLIIGRDFAVTRSSPESC